MQDTFCRHLLFFQFNEIREVFMAETELDYLNLLIYKPALPWYIHSESL